MIKPYDNFVIDAGGGTIDISCNTTDVAFITSSGTVALGSSWVIQPDAGEALEAGNTIQIVWSARATLGTDTITILGILLTQEQASKDLVIFGSCDGSTWTGQILIDSADGVQAVDTLTWTNAGGTKNLKSGIDANYQVITSASISLLGSYVVQPDAGHTFVEGDYFFIKYEGQIALNGNTITIFTKDLPQIQATLGNTMVFTKYDGSAWHTIMWQGVDKNMYRVMGSSTDASPDFLDQKVQNSIEIDTDKLQLVNDTASPAANSYYGTNGSGVKGWNTVANTLLSTTVTLANADILDLYDTPIEVIANPGIGYAIQLDRVTIIIKGTAGTPTPYATNTSLEIITDTATIQQWVDNYILLSTVDRANIRTAATVLTAATDTILVANKSVYVQVATGNPSGGNAGNTLELILLYRIISL